MKKYVIIFLFMTLLASLPVYSARKDTKLILAELEKLGEIIRSLELKVTAIHTDTSMMSKKIGIIEERVGAIAKNQADGNQDKESLLLSLQFLKEELNELKNNVGKINDRLLNMPTQPSTTGTDGDETVPGESAGKPASQSSETIYYMAYSDYISKNYDLAIEGFRHFIKLFPQNGLADNSLYWIGECYYAQKKYQEAVNTFKELKANYNDGDKVPDAILKEGYGLIELGKTNEGIEALKELVSRFPLMEEASLAQQKIKEVMD
ncbi:MAG: tol-pal system protein YbgF [bacterium]|nr:tol-pal system protein YbgF [bacterium]